MSDRMHWLFGSVVAVLSSGVFAAVESDPAVVPTDDEAYDLGLELVRIGTDERFDFSAPEGAEVWGDWEASGAAEDWFRSPLQGRDGQWSFMLGTNEVRSLMVFSYGTMRPAMTNLATFVSPFEAPLGIVPASNSGLLREDSCPSRFWQYHTPSNTHVMTWQNVLLERMVEKPVSFQLEMSDDGCMIFRYDLSRLPDAVVSNALVGVCCDGHGRVFSRIPRELTSLTWYRLEPDFREINYGRSIESVISALGDVDPWTSPGNSGSTAYENAYYTGDPNCKGTPPEADGDFAVLKVTANGSGQGNLIVGKAIVPLLPGAPALKIAVPRGKRIRTKYTGDDTIGCRFDSDDFCIGEMPSGWLVRTGWVAFPNTEATHPCIHRLDMDKVTVSLDPVVEADDFECTWIDSGAVSVERLSPLSAELTPQFYRDEFAMITYRLSHPDYLCGVKQFRQRCEYCPKVEDERDEHGEYRVDEDYFGDDDVLPEPDASLCPIHHVTYIECEGLHQVDFNVATNGEQSASVLKLHMPDLTADHRLVGVSVPTGGEYRCCSCPEHWQNCVTIGAKSRRVAVHCDDEPFVRTTKNCRLDIFGTIPSTDFEDSTVSLCKTGIVYWTRDYTVFGVSIVKDGDRLRRLNELNRDFGLPITVQTNVNRATTIGFRTDVDLPYGTIRLAITNATSRIRLVKRNGQDDVDLILDSETMPEREMSLGEWKRLVKKYTRGRTVEFEVLAYGHGQADLFFGFAAEKDGKYFHDEVTQRISVIRPPLLPDYNRDGRIDDADAWDYANGRVKYFWANSDGWQGDDAFKHYSAGWWDLNWSAPRLPRNCDDNVVNGKNDLVNLCPLSVSMWECFRAWGKEAIYEFYVAMPGDVRFAPVKTDWDKVGKLVREPQRTLSGAYLHETELISTDFRKDSEIPYVIPEEFIRLGNPSSGVFAVEFADTIMKHKKEMVPLTIRIRDGYTEDVLLQLTLQVSIMDVHDMYRWINLFDVCGKKLGSDFDSRTDVLWPDDDHADANVVFVHGYNMHHTEGWDWSQAMFKRLWWSGMDAGFTAVAWRGNQSQCWATLLKTFIAKNYHQNVLNAFRTAESLASATKTIPGKKKYFIAHSLGNMLVSAARQDYGLEYDKYIMLNAAVAMEAYDSGSVTEESKTTMTPECWRGYSDRVKASHWHELFPEGDKRRSLAWKGRFKDVNNTVNFYSSKDEVVANGNDNVYNVFTRKFAWYNQEHDKGGHLVDLCPEAGWAFNSEYLVWEEKKGRNDVVERYSRIRNPYETDVIGDSQMMIQPFFKQFSHGEIHSASGSAYLAKKENSYAAWRALSHGVPAESFAVGANPVPAWEREVSSVGSDVSSNDGTPLIKEIRNINMETECGAHEGDWEHSYFICRSMFDVGGAFGKITEIINAGKLVKEEKR